jgi:tripartite-type tricarboxylate transporter receptor subunit TctC
MLVWALMGACAATTSAAQGTYPSRTVTVISPYASIAAVADPIVRTVLGRLTEKYNQPFVIEARPGADGTIGMTAVARAKPDGYTLTFTNVGPTTLAPFLRKGVAYDPVRDFTPIAATNFVTSYILGGPSLQARDIAEVIRIAREQPGKLTFGVVGAGTRMNVLKFEKALGGKFLIVPYNATDQIQMALVSGTVDLTTNAGNPEAITLGGKLRLLAFNGLTRSKHTPSVPAVAEYVPGFESKAWMGFLGPAGMPRDLVVQLNRDMNAALVEPRTVEIIDKLRVMPAVLSPEELGALIRSEVEANTLLVKQLNIVPE